jgi:hypothetical protein
LILGLTAAGAAGYYFYNAGGNARVAKKSAERMFSPPPQKNFQY